MKFYTWKDIDRYCHLRKKFWQNVISTIEVYPDEMIVYYKTDYSENEAKQCLKNLFLKKINIEEKAINLDRQGKKIKLIFTVEERMPVGFSAPLFEKIIYDDTSYPDYELSELECPVIAFHSYKGGVGRTLSLLAFAKAWNKIHQGSSEGKLLIIDADIEAPGLSWINGQEENDIFSYLDLLTIIQDEDVDDVVSVAVDEISNSTIHLQTDKRIVDHFFMPTFRYTEQLLDLYASPETVVKGKNKGYVLAEILGKIAYALGASLVLIDLRAGISEYSAPFLFDPRVEKYLVTSTSSQSVIGTNNLLKYVLKGIDLKDDANLPRILVNMIPNVLSNQENENIVESLLSDADFGQDDTDLLDSIIFRLPFSSELIHLTEFDQIMKVLEGRDMYLIIEKLVSQYYGVIPELSNNYSGKKRQEIMSKIHDFAQKQITAEAGGTMNLLLTNPIKSLCLRFNKQIPTVVVIGTKGSGKTFLFNQMLMHGNWSSFCNSIDKRYQNNSDGFFLPIVASRNIGNMDHSLKNSIKTFEQQIPFAEISPSVYMDNGFLLDKKKDDKNINWMELWEKVIVKSVNSDLETFDELSEKLSSIDKQVVFLLDGLEEIFKSVSSGNESQQHAIQVLSQDIVNYLKARYNNIGIIIFLRSDLAKNSISVNYTQFIQSQGSSVLKWSSDEALKLVLWVVSQAEEGFYDADIPVEQASSQIIEEYLEKLWGLKLGKRNSKEPYSSRWILAALSDFYGQLQARDIIRFLANASSSPQSKSPYEDRILMPKEIRDAVKVCSKDKVDEIKQEYESLKQIFEKLEKLPTEKKILPIDGSEEILTQSEERLMVQEGYLIRDGEKLYLPESIRNALEFRYVKGARPRVLSLLLKH